MNANGQEVGSGSAHSRLVAGRLRPKQNATSKNERVTITFAPSSEAAIPVYRKLAAACQETHPGIQIDVIPSPVVLDELVATAACFGTTFSAQMPGVRQYVHGLEPLRKRMPAARRTTFIPNSRRPAGTTASFGLCPTRQMR